MSLNFYLEKKTIIAVHEANITHNLTDMARACGIYKCLWRPDENGFRFASELIPLLTDAIVQLKAKPDYFKQFDSPNGWGRYIDFLLWVESLLASCKKHPGARIRTHR